MTDPFRYDDRRVVLTGGASGVGAAALEHLAALGATDVTVLDVKEPTGPASRFVPTDMGDPASVDEAVAAIDGPVDVLFNNAGVAGVHARDLVLRINYLGPRRLTEGLLPQMPRGAAVVNTASIAGQGWPGHLAEISELIAIDDWDRAVAWVDDHEELIAAPYEFSKEVLQVWTMTVAHRTFLEHGVRTNSVCPGPIDTPLMADFHRHMSEQTIKWTVDQTGGEMLTADAIAQVLVLLGLGATGAMNGANVIADHGFTGFMTTGQLDLSGLS